MKNFIIVTTILLLITTITFAQECGPNCPVCSGAGSSGALLAQKSLLLSGLVIPSADEEQTVFNTRLGILNWLDAGLGYAVETEKVLWNVRLQPLVDKENSWKPGLILGTGSVQTGGSDQSIYAQLIKSWSASENVNLQLSVGIATLIPDFDETFTLAGVTTGFYDRYYAFVNYDGKSYHEGVSWVASDWVTISFLMVESELPALSISLRQQL